MVGISEQRYVANSDQPNQRPETLQQSLHSIAFSVSESIHQDALCVATRSSVNATANLIVFVGAEQFTSVLMLAAIECMLSPNVAKPHRDVDR